MRKEERGKRRSERRKEEARRDETIGDETRGEEERRGERRESFLGAFHGNAPADPCKFDDAMASSKSYNYLLNIHLQENWWAWETRDIILSILSAHFARRTLLDQGTRSRLRSPTATTASSSCTVDTSELLKSGDRCREGYL